MAINFSNLKAALSGKKLVGFTNSLEQREPGDWSKTNISKRGKPTGKLDERILKPETSWRKSISSKRGTTKIGA
jgi:hypothetical protein